MCMIVVFLQESVALPLDSGQDTRWVKEFRLTWHSLLVLRIFFSKGGSRGCAVASLQFFLHNCLQLLKVNFGIPGRLAYGQWLILIDIKYEYT